MSIRLNFLFYFFSYDISFEGERGDLNYILPCMLNRNALKTKSTSRMQKFRKDQNGNYVLNTHERDSDGQ